MDITQGAAGNLIARYRAVLKKCQVKNFLIASFLSVLTLCGTTNTVYAEDTPEAEIRHIRNENSAGYDLIIYKQGYGNDTFKPEGKKVISGYTASKDQIDAIENGVKWWNQISSKSAKNTSPARIIILTDSYDGTNAEGGSDTVTDGKYKRATELVRKIFADQSGQDGYEAYIYNIEQATTVGWYTEPMHLLPSNGTKADLTSTITHELAHSWGMASTVNTEDQAFKSTLSLFDQNLYDKHNNKAKPGMEISFDKDEKSESGAFVLAGEDCYSGLSYTSARVQEVLAGAQLSWPSDAEDNMADGVTLDDIKIPKNSLPINGENGDFSHIELQNALMSHQSYRNWNTLMEAELAVLQDCGVEFDRKLYFGRSFYHSNESNLVNDIAWSSPAPYAIGLHIYGSNNTVTQNANIIASGSDSAGIRVDGSGNNLIVSSSSIITVNGEYGTGLMVSYGKGHKIQVDGSIEANGNEGVGIRLDFGDNEMGNYDEYRGSYIRTKFNEDIEQVEESKLLPELQGPLVESLKIKRSISGTRAAILISENAYVKEISILSGASINGDIISYWNPNGTGLGGVEIAKVQHDDPSSLTTKLIFGDIPSFAMNYKGKIIGADSIHLSVNAGVLNYSGEAEVLSTSLSQNARLNLLDGALLNTSEIRLAQNAVLSIDPSHVNTDTLSTSGSVLVGSGSILAIGTDSNETAYKAASRFNMMPEGNNDNFTVKEESAVMNIGTNGSVQLSSSGSLTVDGSQDADSFSCGTADSIQINNGALLLINAKREDAAIVGSGDTSFSTAPESIVLLTNLQTKQTTPLISGLSSENIEGDFIADSRMLSLSPEVEDGDLVLNTRVNDAKKVFSGLDSDIAASVNELYGQSLNDVDDSVAGHRFLSRATNILYGDDLYRTKGAKSAVRTMESAVRLSMLANVPAITMETANSVAEISQRRTSFTGGLLSVDTLPSEKTGERRAFSMWIAPLWKNIQANSLSGGGIGIGYSSNIGGLVLGGDWTNVIGENSWRLGFDLGAGGGYTASHGDGSDTSSNMKFWTVGLYGGWNNGTFSVMADAGFLGAFHKIKQDMPSNMEMGNLEAEVNSTAFTAGMRGEWRVALSDTWKLIPHLGVRWTMLRSQEYDIDCVGSGTLAKADGPTQDLWQFPVGLALIAKFSTSGGWMLKPSADFIVTPATGVHAHEKVRFTGLSKQMDLGTRIRDDVNYGGRAGLEATYKNFSMGLDYSLQAGQHTTSHGLTANLRWEF